MPQVTSRLVEQFSGAFDFSGVLVAELPFVLEKVRPVVVSRRSMQCH